MHPCTCRQRYYVCPAHTLARGDEAGEISNMVVCAVLDRYEEQLAAGGADANPNLMPIGYKPQSLGARGKQTHQRNDCFAVPAPIGHRVRRRSCPVRACPSLV